MHQLDKLKISLAIGLGVVLVLAGVNYIDNNSQIEKMRSELVLKSKTLEERETQIHESTLTISTQRQQIEEKTAQLVDLNSQIEKLKQSFELDELVISAKAIEVEQLNNELTLRLDQIESLELQASGLQDKIQELQNKIRDNEEEIAALSGRLDESQEQIQSFERTSVHHYSLAVDQDNNGLVLPIEVEIIPSGHGTVSIDVKNVKYETGFQTAVRNAVQVASDYTRVKVSDKDIIIRVINEFDDPSGELRVDGGSAGALITAMLIAGLSDQDIDSSVLITGTIEPDGTVGRIVGLEQKTAAAIDFGARTLVVPEEQDFEDASIRIIGVSDIDDVVKYLINQKKK